MRRPLSHRSAFTLIELSIVLVIIGLIVGGVLVGQSLIRAAEVRATISQIERYNTAVNTFRVKYDALPGDMNAATASQFGFAARGAFRGEGDGNGLIEGVNADSPSQYGGDFEGFGETTMFWVDLSAAGLIEGGFNTASSTNNPGTITGTSTPGLDAFFPAAKLGTGNYVYVWSGGLTSGPPWGNSNGINYFGMSAVTQLASGWALQSTPAISVAQAYLIDKKIDDGLPQLGRVTTMYVGSAPNGPPLWVGASPGTATTGSATTCYDNGGNASNSMQYSMGQNSGAGVNCALSFQFQ